MLVLVLILVLVLHMWRDKLFVVDTQLVGLGVRIEARIEIEGWSMLGWG